MNISEAFPQVAAGYLSNHHVPVDQLPTVLRSIWLALAAVQPEQWGHVAQPNFSHTMIAQPQPPAPQIETKPTQHKSPAEIKASQKDPEFLISFIDGKKYKTLKRHIGLHGYDEDSYRDTFGLPPSYPMVAPSYSLARKTMAVKMGLGRR